MPLSQFHPVVARWFSDALGTPTPAQRHGWAAVRSRRHTLIAAPTGSGKTLAAFLTALNDLFQDGLRAPLPDQVRVLYVSPLKALSADIHKNLAEPRSGIRRLAHEAGLEAPRITAAVRTGDTTQAERAAMLRTPPHILVTTPESLYLLLTSERSREMLRTVETVIVDEIHAVIGTRRGAHLALSLERLQEIARAPLLRLGLSATQKPIDEVARFLVGTAGIDERGAVSCAVVNEGHRRQLDLAVEIPGSLLEAVMSREVWEECYERLTALIADHRTTLVFVNTRRMAERLARHLSDRLGDAAVTAHHGSLSKEKRLDAETRLKSGQLKALVATASLELGIDIGSVDLVCQMGSPRRIATLLQRVGRSGHTVSGLPKGRLFPVSRDDLIECAALLRAVRLGELDAIVSHDAPLDVLAQQIVAETACCDYAEDRLFALVRRAWPYRDLSRAQFEAVVKMTADGFSTRRGRRGALVHRDEVNGRVRGRRGARLLAVTSGGAIPEVADYRVVLEPEDTFIGTLNEDFAIESAAGDVFQLGNASWRVLQVGSGVVRVADARGAPPTIPFWFGEAPARSDELSRAVSDLRGAVDRLLGEHSRDEAPRPQRAAVDWLVHETGLSAGAAEQAIAYLADGRRALGVLPTQEMPVLERFFDESGGMQLVLHAPFGSRVNKAWGLALRKRFCRQFNFELQAAATDDAVLLSLGPQHSFPLADVFRYLHPATALDVLVQAFLDAPVFQTRWRWNATISLAVPRNRGGRKVPPQLQRMLADDLMAAVFPDAAACLENIPGDRRIPDHPLVDQTVRDCLQEAMDFEGLARVLTQIHAGQLQCVSRDTPEPSVLAHEILNARPYAFLDDAPLEERRTQAVYARRASEPSTAGDLGALDPGAIARVRDEARPDPRDADELHDALLTFGYLTGEESGPFAELFARLATARRAAQVRGQASTCWTAAERLPELLAVHPAAALEPALSVPASRVTRQWARDEAIAELLRGRLLMVGPTTARALADSLGIAETEAAAALRGLEADGVVLRGSFTPRPASGPVTAVDAVGDAKEPHERGASRAARASDRAAGPASAEEWCDRRLLARIHRYTLNRLRAEIEPVSPADFVRFLMTWQHVHPSARLTGTDGLRAIVATLDGFELAAGAWERYVLPARLDRYDPTMLDMLCLTGEVGWARLSTPSSRAAATDARDPLNGRPADGGRLPRGELVWARPAPLLQEPDGRDVGDEEDADSTASPDGSPPSRLVPATPVALFLREHAAAWQTLRAGRESELGTGMPPLGAAARAVLDLLGTRGASFFHELAGASRLEDRVLRRAIGELVAAGLVASDGFAGLRAVAGLSHGIPRTPQGRGRHAGRWGLLRGEPVPDAHEAAVEAQARVLLRRYGVVFRRLVAREAQALPWRTLARVYRRLEARGEIRGGRFVAGMYGEQFALPDAVTRLREVRRSAGDRQLICISAADPLNLTGIVTEGPRVRTIASHRVVYRDGVPLAALEGDYVRPLSEFEPGLDVASALTGRRVPAVARGYVGRTG